MATAIGCEIRSIYLPDTRRQHGVRGIIRSVGFLIVISKSFPVPGQTISEIEMLFRKLRGICSL